MNRVDGSNDEKYVRRRKDEDGNDSLRVEILGFNDKDLKRVLHVEKITDFKIEGIANFECNETMDGINHDVHPELGKYDKSDVGLSVRCEVVFIDENNMKRHYAVMSNQEVDDWAELIAWEYCFHKEAIFLEMHTGLSRCVIEKMQPPHWSSDDFGEVLHSVIRDKEKFIKDSIKEEGRNAFVCGRAEDETYSKQYRFRVGCVFFFPYKNLIWGEC
jgi:hypothetical protein